MWDNRKAQTLRCVPLSHYGWKAFGFNKKLKPIWTIADYTDAWLRTTKTPPITSVWGGLIAQGDHEMKWNHRVVDMTAENGGEPLFAIREVFYNDDGVPTSHGEPNAVSEDMEGLEWCIGEMRDALKHPVLKPEDFEPKSWAKLIQEK
jgi:hypothetical protein